MLALVRPAVSNHYKAFFEPESLSRRLLGRRDQSIARVHRAAMAREAHLLTRSAFSFCVTSWT